MKRATIKLKTPNPLFEKWITEWIEETINSGNIAKSNILTNALESLKKFPLVLKTGKECMILEHFDTNLCVQLDRKLVDHRKNSSEEPTGIACAKEDASEKPKESEAKEHKKKTKIKGYLPTYRSSAYALLLTLYKNERSTDYKGYMTKIELQKEAQPLSDASLKKAQAGSFYTGWTSMSQLIAKGLVIKTSNPARFSLTKEGRDVASRLAEIEPTSHESECQANTANQFSTFNIPELTDIMAPVSLRSKKEAPTVPMEEETEDSQPVEEEEEDAVLSPGTFDTILLVDTAETSGAGSPDDETISELTATGILFEVRHLKVGDFLWICRSRTSPIELVLPFIVERKRLDDLSKSIMDGRFHEQKFRLKKCGVYNVIYLIEDNGGQKRFGVPISSLHQAIVNSMVTDEFTVKITSNHQESMNYLATITTMLTNMFRNKVLFSCRKSEWSLDIMDDTVFLLTFTTFISGMGKSRVPVDFAPHS
ncbi:mus81 structure-specific endonuclease subunit isoform X2 [Rhodnius prolixus]|uniref:mus81 structure-specific endonuclease subunit isoform X2 n=1 Tax=Rhodnius prolixus TaxID=13249 RepID=UPI003D18C258